VNGPVRLPRPSLSELVFVLWALVIPLGFAGRLVNSDGDLARHIRLGQLMLERGGVLHQDVFSWTRAGEPFLAFEWGSELFFALVHGVGGLAGVAVAAGLILAVSYGLLCRFLLSRGVEPVLAYLAIMGAAVMSSAHWVARPHLFTMLGVALLFPLLEGTSVKRAGWAVPLFAVWCNMHGGFVYGLLLVGTYLAGDLLEAVAAQDRAEWLGRARAHVALLALGLAATVINPTGLELHRHVRDFFGLTLLLEVTEEFQPPDFGTASGAVMLAGIAVVLAAIAWSRRRPTWPRTLAIASNLLFALRARRNLALFGFVAYPVAALHLDPFWRRLPDRGGVRAAFSRDQARSRPGPWSAATLVVLIILAVTRGSPGGVAVVPDEFDPGVFPIAAVERARSAGLEGRVFHDVTWGGYMLLAWPEQRVFIDGGTDHYGEDLVGEALKIAELGPGWETALDSLGITVALLPPRALLVHTLTEGSGWDVWYCDATAAVVTLRASVGQPPQAAPQGGWPPGCPVGG
jgi:hypothetical protein